MKKLNTIFIVLTLIFVSNSYAQTQPDKKTTYNYIEKLFSDTYDFELKFNDGVVYKIAFQDGYFEFDTYNIRFSRRALTEGYCTEGYRFSEVNWAKMESITDWNGISTNSPVGVLYIKFPSNSVLRTGYIDSNCNKEGFSSFGTTQSVSYVLFPYLNQEGVRERLVKALNHLSKLEKEEQAKNDPFGN
ncbi:hypothetical protein [Flavobacterium sp. MK4S-17]|uniref:hypothetical protein n=1 Tax=Flavobacterium sp. MK4S-17 TaxID=2543737 RepID=UPI001358CFA4|nr:hypothetical protein [Flavobacterium sp. MK4S-17]